MRLIALLFLSVPALFGNMETPGLICNEELAAAGVCPPSEIGSVIVAGSQPIGGSPGSGAGTVGGAPIDTSAAELAYRQYLQMLHDRCVAMGEDPAVCPPPPPPPGEPIDAAAFEPITISDLAAFRPIVGELVVEPDGWGVIGTPTNFYATAETHTMDGELFDVPIQVRWTPTSYVFDYGDGTVEETEASGTAWSGADQSWTETATSHAYASRDDVNASVTVVFTAEVNAGAGWFAVPGTLPVQAPAVAVKVFEVDTVLTNGDCAANPAAAGCG